MEKHINAARKRKDTAGILLVIEHSFWKAPSEETLLRRLLYLRHKHKKTSNVPRMITFFP